VTKIFNRTDMKERRRRLRRHATPQELRLKTALRCRQLAGHKFRFNPSIAHYVVDFYCAKQRLVVEIDGSQHYTPEGLGNDAVRTEFLRSLGIRVVRFTNREVDEELPRVLAAIAAALRH
jgi:very-short-patch-repair endonuclease